MERGSSPFRSLEEQFERLQRQFEEALEAWDGGELLEPSTMRSMGIDLADRGDEFMLTADVPGFERDDIDLRLSENRIFITAERETEEHDDEDEFYIKSERARKALSRSFRLPEPIDESTATATYKNGVLTVRMPKKEPSSPNGTQIDIE